MSNRWYRGYFAGQNCIIAVSDLSRLINTNTLEIIVIVRYRGASLVHMKERG